MHIVISGPQNEGKGTLADKIELMLEEHGVGYLRDDSDIGMCIIFNVPGGFIKTSV